MAIVLRILIIALTVGGIVQSVHAQEDSLKQDNQKIVYRFSIKEAIMKPAERKFNQAMNQADSVGADFILITLDTYGGAVDVADRMRTRLLNATPVTMVFIENNAASAGALISIACDSIFMKPEANMGAAVVVTGQGGAAGEKYQSYFREKFRATAIANGRDPDIAEAMVNPDVHIPGVVDSGKILTFTADAAIANNYCDKIVKSEEEILEYMNLQDATIREYKLTIIDKIIRFFTDPMVSGLLLTVIFFGIFFELQSPGIGFPFIAALIAAVGFFAPLYLDGLAENWEILVFIGGLVLIALEIFVIPGFGVAGISGIALIVGGLVLSLVRNVNFDFRFVDTADISQAVVTVVGSIIVTTILLIIFAKNFYKSPLTQFLIFKDTQQAKEGYSTNTFSEKDPTGETGIAVTDLRPSGVIEIGDVRYDAFTAGEYIESGTKVIVKEARGFSVKVEEIS